MAVIRVGESEQQQADGDKDSQVDQELAGLFGAAEVKRISLAMVEAAFDGCAVTGNTDTCGDELRLLWFDLWCLSHGSPLIDDRHGEDACYVRGKSSQRPTALVYARPFSRKMLCTQCLTPPSPPLTLQGAGRSQERARQRVSH